MAASLNQKRVLAQADAIKVLMVSTSYPSSESDWKGIFIRNILQALAYRDDAKISVWQPPGPLPTGISSVLTRSDEKWLDLLMDMGGIAHVLKTKPLRGLYYTGSLLSRLRRMYLRCQDHDIWHVNWLQNALPLPSDKRALVVSVLGTDMALLKVPGIVPLLRRVFGQRQTIICPNAEWMVARLERLFGTVATVKYLPFGIDSRWFELVRSEPLSKNWLCVSRLTPDKIGSLFDWGEEVFCDSGKELHLFGPNQASMEIPTWVNYHGSVTPDELRQHWFPSAQGLISLSRHSEGRPQVMLEAMASNLPVIASNIEAHSDLIEHGKTGWLCGDQKSLKEGIDMISMFEVNAQLGHSARQFVRKSSGTWDDFSDRLLKIYQTIR